MSEALSIVAKVASTAMKSIEHITKTIIKHMKQLKQKVLL